MAYTPWYAEFSDSYINFLKQLDLSGLPDDDGTIPTDDVDLYPLIIPVEKTNLTPTQARLEELISSGLFELDYNVELLEAHRFAYPLYCSFMLIHGGRQQDALDINSKIKSRGISINHNTSKTGGWFEVTYTLSDPSSFYKQTIYLEARDSLKIFDAYEILFTVGGVTVYLAYNSNSNVFDSRAYSKNRDMSHSEIDRLLKELHHYLFQDYDDFDDSDFGEKMLI